MSYNRSEIFQTNVKAAKNTLLVSDEHRKNSLSLTPGGSVVKVIYEDGSSRVYDKIKNVEAYISCLLRNSDGGIIKAFPIN